MFAIKLNIEPGKDKLVDLSSCVDETITSYDLMNVIGRSGIEKELRHKIDIFASQRVYEEDMNGDLEDKYDARIYIDDRLDTDSAVFVILSDRDIAALVGESILFVRGTVYTAARFFTEMFTDGIDDGTITLCDVMDGVLAALFFKSNNAEYSRYHMTQMWLRLRNVRRNGVNILDAKDPMGLLELVCN